MIPRLPKKRPIVRQAIGGLIILEAAGFGLAYFAWRKTNKDRDFRFSLKEKFPFLLESYYKFGELIDSDAISIRKLDEKIWSQK